MNKVVALAVCCMFLCGCTPVMLGVSCASLAYNSYRSVQMIKDVRQAKNEQEKSRQIKRAANLTLMGTSNVALTMDWLQTRTIALNPTKFSESNFILGKHPSLMAVDFYFAGIIAANVGMHYVLPEEWQPYWYAGMTGFELFWVISNFGFGIGF